MKGAQDCTLSSVVSRTSRYPSDPMVAALTRVHDFLSTVHRVLRIETRCSIGGPGGQSASGRQLRIARRPSGRRMRLASSSAASWSSISCQMSAKITRSQDAVARCVSRGTPYNSVNVVRSDRAGQAGAKLIDQPRSPLYGEDPAEGADAATNSKCIKRFPGADLADRYPGTNIELSEESSRRQPMLAVPDFPGERTQ